MSNWTCATPVPGATWAEQQEQIMKGGLMILVETVTAKPLVINTPMNILEFITHFFEDFNVKYNTAYAANPTVVTCYPKRYRSLVDIFLIAKTYFPDVTLEQVASAILYYPYLCTGICSTLRRRVYFSGNVPAANRENLAPTFYVAENTRDEFGRTIPFHARKLLKVKNAAAHAMAADKVLINATNVGTKTSPPTFE